MDYQETLTSLRQQQEVSMEEGAEVIFKKSPHLKEGSLDLLEDDSNDTDAKSPFDIDDKPDVLNSAKMALEIRKLMGSPNKDLSKNISESEDSFTSEGNNIKVYIYKNNDKQDLLPAFVFYHGGGFFGGKPEVVANACKGLAEKIPAVVINVDYRIAPEFPAPAAVNDCYGAVKWVHENAASLGVDPTKIIVGGDSAGGNLSAATAWLDREKGTNYIGMQALIYPTVCLDSEKIEECSWTVDQYKPEPELYNHLNNNLMGMVNSHLLIENVYIKEMDPTDPTFSPLLANDISNMPPTFIAIAEFDYLRPSSERYAAKLQAGNVPVKCICYKGMEHAFIDKYGIYPHAEDCIDEIAKMVKTVFCM